MQVTEIKFTSIRPNSAIESEKILNYYEILGVQVDATPEELKEAYRKFALKNHPDRNRAPDSEERFRDGSKAYNTLRDPELRAEYDLFELGLYQGQRLEDYLLQRPRDQHPQESGETGRSWREVELAIIEGDWPTVIESFGFTELLSLFKRRKKNRT